MFVDKAQIHVKAGNGGNGAVAFHREKYVASGGPDGGDGGRGGDVILQADPNLATLMDFRYKRKYAASNGGDGSGDKMTGKDGQSVVIRVPVGTVVKDAETGAVIKDMSEKGEYVLARGGIGGWGNSHFATPTRQCPRFAKSGLPGEELDVVLELKLLADVGLVGFPNVGKSTFLAAVTRAHPKIANYHFTTLYPNLGVAYAGEGVSFILADIPGIIEGASEGAGLGHDFLRHIDRCRLIIHVVDISGSEARDPIEDFNTIQEELRQYSPELADRPQIVCGNKCDMCDDPELTEKFRAYMREIGAEYYEISAAAHIGLQEVVYAASRKLKELPPVTVYEPTYVPDYTGGRFAEPDIRHEGDLWIIEGGWMAHLVRNVNFSDYESRMFFDKSLRSSGLFDKLEEMGIEEGDTVSIYNLEFEYQR